MTIEIQVPPLPESVADATIAAVHIADGDAITRDQNLFDLETDKVMIEVPSAESGVVVSVKVKAGDVVTSGQLLATIEPGAVAAAPVAKVEEPAKADADDTAMSPAVRRLISEHGLDATSIKGTGKNGRIVKSDVEAAIAAAKAPVTNEAAHSAATTLQAGRVEERVPMTRLRARIAERLLQVKKQTAMLTTFNEIDMKPVMDMRAKYKKLFEKEHDVRLGFMSFFVKAAVAALQKYPEVNASIDGNDIVYHNYEDIGIAVGSARGLVVPIFT